MNNDNIRARIEVALAALPNEDFLAVTKDLLEVRPIHLRDQQAISNAGRDSVRWRGSLCNPSAPFGTLRQAQGAVIVLVLVEPVETSLCFGKLNNTKRGKK